MKYLLIVLFAVGCGKDPLQGTWYYQEVQYDCLHSVTFERDNYVKQYICSLDNFSKLGDEIESGTYTEYGDQTLVFSPQCFQLRRN